MSNHSGFSLVEVVFGLVLLGLIGTVTLEGALQLARVVRQGRLAVEAAVLGATAVHRAELAYLGPAPACAPPAAGAILSRGTRAAWTAMDTSLSMDLAVALSWGPRAGSADTVVTRVGCR